MDYEDQCSGPAVWVELFGFIHLLDNNHVQLNRKVLADLAVTDPQAFAKIVDEVKSA